MLDCGTDALGEFGAGNGFFTGEYLHSLDPKRRLTIPSDWRVIVGEPQRFYVLPAVESPCLSLYRVPDFLVKLKRLQEHSIVDSKARQMARIIGARSAFIGWDSVGRVRIKEGLLESAGLSGRVKLVGALDRIELWNPERWEEVGALEDDSSLEEAVRYVKL